MTYTPPSSTPEQENQKVSLQEQLVNQLKINNQHLSLLTEVKLQIGDIT